MHPVPGKLKSRITYMEMTQPPASPPPPAAVKLTPLRAERPSLAVYRFLYETVGEPWLWWERRCLADEDLAAIVHDPMVEVYVLYMGGVPAGFSELDRRQEPDIELAYFGLVPEYIGLGLGRYFLDWAIRQAWSYGPKRVWVNTCTEDHPRALPLYQRLGFQVYAQEPATLDPNL